MKIRTLDYILFIHYRFVDAWKKTENSEIKNKRIYTKWQGININTRQILQLFTVLPIRRAHLSLVYVPLW